MKWVMYMYILMFVVLSVRQGVAHTQFNNSTSAINIQHKPSVGDEC